MATKKRTNTHTSARKKASAKTAKTAHAKKAASKGAQLATTSKRPRKNAESPAELKKREELTLRAFRMAYESNQRGTFRRII